jgi:hypothetical protein
MLGRGLQQLTNRLKINQKINKMFKNLNKMCFITKKRSMTLCSGYTSGFGRGNVPGYMEDTNERT